MQSSLAASRATSLSARRPCHVCRLRPISWVSGRGISSYFRAASRHGCLIWRKGAREMGSLLQRLEILLIGLVLLIAGAVVIVLLTVHPPSPAVYMQTTPL